MGYEASWGQAEWYNFFVIARNEESQGPSDYWNDQMRHDCLAALTKEIQSFKNSVQEHIKPILRQDTDLTHSTHYFNEAGRLETTKQHLKWNFEEF